MNVFNHERFWKCVLNQLEWTKISQHTNFDNANDNPFPTIEFPTHHE